MDLISDLKDMIKQKTFEKIFELKESITINGHKNCDVCGGSGYHLRGYDQVRCSKCDGQGIIATDGDEHADINSKPEVSEGEVISLKPRPRTGERKGPATVYHAAERFRLKSRAPKAAGRFSSRYAGKVPGTDLHQFKFKNEDELHDFLDQVGGAPYDHLTAVLHQNER